MPPQLLRNAVLAGNTTISGTTAITGEVYVNGAPLVRSPAQNEDGRVDAVFESQRKLQRAVELLNDRVKDLGDSNALHAARGSEDTVTLSTFTALQQEVNLLKQSQQDKEAITRLTSDLEATTKEITALKQDISAHKKTTTPDVLNVAVKSCVDSAMSDVGTKLFQLDSRLTTLTKKIDAASLKEEGK